MLGLYCPRKYRDMLMNAIPLLIQQCAGPCEHIPSRYLYVQIKSVFQSCSEALRRCLAPTVSKGIVCDKSPCTLLLRCDA
jgi:hypothetical protein